MLGFRASDAVRIIEVIHDDGRAGLVQQNRGGLAQSLTAACDEGNSPAQIEIQHVCTAD